MRKKVIVGVLLIIILVVSFTSMPTKAESIVNAMLDNYNSINTYKASVTVEEKYTYKDRVFTQETEGTEKPEFIEVEKTAINSAVYNLIYKKPYRLKTIEADGTEHITASGWIYKYKPGQNFACKSVAKTPLLLVQLGGDYFKTIEEMANRMYDFEYLGRDEINGEECEVIKLIPKVELNPFAGEEIRVNPGKIWISTNNHMPVRTETYEDDTYSEWKIRTTYSNTRVNIDVPDAEFEFLEEIEILPKTAEFSSLQEAQNEFKNEIIIPQYVPPEVELDYIEVNKQCGGSAAQLNYKKDDEIVLTVWQRVSNKAEETGGDGLVGGETWLGEPCEAIVCEVMVQGLRAKVVRNVASNYVNANKPITNIRWKCRGINFSVDTTFSDTESIKILESVNCG